MRYSLICSVNQIVYYYALNWQKCTLGKEKINKINHFLDYHLCGVPCKWQWKQKNCPFLWCFYLAAHFCLLTYWNIESEIIRRFPEQARKKNTLIATELNEEGVSIFKRQSQMPGIDGNMKVFSFKVIRLIWKTRKRRAWAYLPSLQLKVV